MIADLTPRYRHVIMDAYLDLKTNYKGDNQKALKELKEILEKELKEFLGVTSLKEKGFLFDISLIRKFFDKNNLNYLMEVLESDYKDVNKVYIPECFHTYSGVRYDFIKGDFVDINGVKHKGSEQVLKDYYESEDYKSVIEELKRKENEGEEVNPRVIDYVLSEALSSGYYEPTKNAIEFERKGILHYIKLAKVLNENGDLRFVAAGYFSDKPKEYDSAIKEAAESVNNKLKDSKKQAQTISKNEKDSEKMRFLENAKKAESYKKQLEKIIEPYKEVYNEYSLNNEKIKFLNQFAADAENDIKLDYKAILKRKESENKKLYSRNNILRRKIKSIYKKIEPLLKEKIKELNPNKDGIHINIISQYPYIITIRDPRHYDIAETLKDIFTSGLEKENFIFLENILPAAEINTLKEAFKSLYYDRINFAHLKLSEAEVKEALKKRSGFLEEYYQSLESQEAARIYENAKGEVKSESDIEKEILEKNPSINNYKDENKKKALDLQKKLRLNKKA